LSGVTFLYLFNVHVPPVILKFKPKTILRSEQSVYFTK